jgi:phosphodiesterase/alkaline phosphatase D-like protein
MFPNGVSAGDTRQTDTVLWAKSAAAGSVRFEVSTFSDFRTIKKQVAVNISDPSLPAKALITGLEAGTTYHYRVIGPSGAVDTGQFETSAAADTHPGFHFGVSGDWRGELGPYYSISNADSVSPDVPKTQAVTLADFRAKHAEVYDTTSGLNAWADLQRSTTILATIDDHEVTNNFAGGASPASDPRFSGTKATYINDTSLYETGIRAFQEYNALRNETYGSSTRTNPVEARFEGEQKLYRYNSYGDDAAVFVLDARSFRDAPLRAADVSSTADVGRFLLQSFDTGRTLLGRTQFELLKQDLAKAQADGMTWKFIMLPEPIQNLGPVGAEDRFEGYAAERTNLLRFIKERGIENVVFVSADLHGTVVNNLTYQNGFGGAQIATGAFEIVTGAVASGPVLGPTTVNNGLKSGVITAEFKIDPFSQQLLVTVWGIDTYGTGNIPTEQPVPRIVSQFSVNPRTTSTSVGSDHQPLVDDAFYLGRYTLPPGVDPEVHYATTGWKEGFDPNAFFSTRGYLAANPDVAAGGTNPLMHYDQYGWKEGRDPSASFDNELYVLNNPAAAGMNPLAHYLAHGRAEGRATFVATGTLADIDLNSFDREYYLLSNPDVAAAGLDPKAHFNEIGVREGRNPNAVFDTAAYLETYWDVADAGVNPLDHYDSHGRFELRDPSASFDTYRYLDAYEDVRVAGVNPLLHYLEYGRAEGRTAFDDGVLRIPDGRTAFDDGLFNP